MRKNEKDNNEKKLDALFERLTKKAIEWEAEKDALDENNLLDKELQNKQDTDSEEEDN